MNPAPQGLWNGQPVAAEWLMERGLAYGDGVFRTMRAESGVIHFWADHWRKCSEDAARLGIGMPAQSVVEAEWRSLSPTRGACKLVVTRGASARGYAPEPAAPSSRLVSVSPLPPRPAHPVTVRWCRMRLGTQPFLAGIKHLNRLEQVMARREWDDPAIDDGLMLDMEGMVACGVRANLFVLRGETLLTHPLHEGGIHGLTRRWLIENAGDVGLTVREAGFGPAVVHAADAVWLTNSLQGILPVGQIGNRPVPQTPLCEELQARWLAEGAAKGLALA